jgi:hypothetical protein
MNRYFRKLLDYIFIWIKEYSHPIRIFGLGCLCLSLVLAIFWLTGYKTDAAAYIFQLLSTILFAAPLASNYYLNIKPLKEMPFNEIMNYIETTSPISDWHSSSRGNITEHFLNIDPRLRFKMSCLDDGIQMKNFVEPWANRHPDPNATGYWCDLVCNGDFLDRTILVGIDGGRALVPPPEIGTNTISKYKYFVAKVFDSQNTLDEYIQRSGLSVSN